MATVTDEDVLELVERFDVPLEDTVEVERLQRALAEKLKGASGAPELTSEFLGRFQRGLELKYEVLEPLGIATVPEYRDIRGRFASAADAAKRDEQDRILPMQAKGAYSVSVSFLHLATGRKISYEDVRKLF